MTHTHKHSDGPWVAALVKCCHCPYEWATVHRYGTASLSCPSCNKDTAIRPVLMRRRKAVKKLVIVD